MRYNESILFWAFRYALGRSTYAVDDVVSAIRGNYEHLDVHFRAKIVSEINEQIDAFGKIGMECDMNQWLHLSSMLDGSRKVTLEAYNGDTDKWEKHQAYRHTDGLYYDYSMRVRNFHTVKNVENV
jgi:hypothetical protein